MKTRLWSNYIAIPAVAAIAITALLYFTGCETLDQGTGSVNDSIQAIDEAISALDVNSGQWQQILTDLGTKVSSGLKNDITVILQRATQSVAEQANCLVDIRIRQIKLALEALRARLLNTPPPTIEPYICEVAPTSIQMSLLLADPDFSRKVDISGYDMDKGDIRVRIERNSNSFRLLSRGTFSRQTHYHAVFDFSSVNIATSDKRFVFYNGNKRLIEVPILQKHCETKTASQPVQTVTVSGFQKTAGDPDFGWNDARVTVDISLSISGDNVVAAIQVSANEVGGDTKGTKTLGKTLYTNVDSRFLISKIKTIKTFSGTFRNRTDTAESKDYGTELVKKIIYHVKRNGFDDLPISTVDIEFNKITVELKEKAGCID